jgi:pyoverdine/dityrosine biosynthesis protein Dit1
MIVAPCSSLSVKHNKQYKISTAQRRIFTEAFYYIHLLIYAFPRDTTNVQRAVTYYVPEMLTIALFTSVRFTSLIIFT